jgi:hypothetical protein
MSATRILSIIALLLAVASLLFQGPLLLVSVILLAIVEVIRG